MKILFSDSVQNNTLVQASFRKSGLRDEGSQVGDLFTVMLACMIMEYQQNDNEERYG